MCWAPRLRKASSARGTKLVCSFSMATSVAASARTGTARGDVDHVPGLAGLVAGVDANGANARLQYRPHQVNRQQAVVETCTHHFDAFGEHERPLELTGRDPAMEEDPIGIVGLLAANDQLAF